jgi:UDP-GlcNAc:undecaprenyl-phosphate GlcNAc-1-phosphate transferase
MTEVHLISYVVSFCVVIAVVLLFRKPAARLGLIDMPGGRKEHNGATPVIGGIAMFIAFMLGVFAYEEPLTEFYALFAGLLTLVLIGLLDDLHDLSARSRFVAQISAALLMTTWGGVVLEDLGNLFGGGSIHLQDWAIPFTVFAVIGIINAFNMIDGADGLAGGVSLVALGLFGSVALIVGMVLHATLIFTLAGAVLGFLVFNMRSPWRKQASIFMGDAGSMMLGFALVWFAVDLSRIITPVAVAWIFSIPLMDTVSCMLRRILKGLSPFSADREHLHHVLMRAGLSVSGAVWLIILISFLMGLVGLASWHYEVPEYVMFYAFMLLFAGYYFGMSHAWKLAKFFRS